MRASRLEMMSCASICRQISDGVNQYREALGFGGIHRLLYPYIKEYPSNSVIDREESIRR